MQNTSFSNKKKTGIQRSIFKHRPTNAILWFHHSVDIRTWTTLAGVVVNVHVFAWIHHKCRLHRFIIKFDSSKTKDHNFLCSPVCVLHLESGDIFVFHLNKFCSKLFISIRLIIEVDIFDLTHLFLAIYCDYWQFELKLISRNKKIHFVLELRNTQRNNNTNNNI